MKTLNTTTAKFFGKTVDLTKLDKYPKPKLKGAKFVGYTFLDTTSTATQNFLAVQDENTGIRAEGTNWKNVRKTANSHEIREFLYDKFASDPIALDITNMEVENGRTRIKAAVTNFQKAIPVAMFEFPKKKSAKLKKINGLRTNNHVEANRVTRDDVIQATVDLVVNKKEVACTKAAIRHFIETELEAGDMLPQKDITIAIDEAFEIAQTGQSILMITKERNEWIQWLRAQGFNPDDYVLCQVDRTWNVSNVWRLEILPNYRVGAKKAKLLLFTKEKLPRVAKERVQSFVNDLEQLYTDTYSLVNYEMNRLARIGVFPSTDLNDRPFEIVGCMPQIVGENEDQMIVPVEEYVK